MNTENSVQPDSSAEEHALIERETHLVLAMPPADSRRSPKPRRPLSPVVDDLRLAQAVRFMERNMAESALLNAVAATSI
ncbi:hypothetical protein M3I54_23000 [Paraburkholderia sp. CNPSo 3274]|uniref:hypothetical protein n=1 Tax=Paraburkholderia sp. CNPSo 3274 TaxID=2940932 RepID=UPI0020B72F3E|nr:hypothetical protein [Paraburkholderia sp. CNPSo 3274]MCP3709815.1 hypothetical protein [Paraburkholderia sp. CNPSo 3274]